MQQLTPNTLLQGGKYKIEKVLGQGGFGITYLAEQVMLGRKVAIKEFFMKELCERDETTSHVTLGTEGSRDTVNRFREKFLKEARNIARLNHPNIVRIIDVFEENGTAYYVMEYAEGGSLADKVKKDGYLSEPVATRYILQVAEALDYIHQRKMNHLDIKPANIMINEKDEAVLIDFGLSKQYDATTGNQTSTTPVGISEGYAPMEQYMQDGVGEFSPETDIYALGATFFKLLTGTTPPNASLVNNQGLPVDELQAKGVNKNAIDVICKAMEGKKRDRIHDIATFISNFTLNDTSFSKSSKNKIDESTIFQKDESNSEDTICQAVGNNVIENDSDKKVKVKKGSKKSLLWIVVIIGTLMAIAISLGIRNSKPTNVENTTIVLTKGHESKRSFVYSGTVDKNGLPSGQGKAAYPETKSCSASTFVGDFINGLPFQGELIFTSGVKYSGTFTSDGFYKEGTLTDKDGYFFKGTFSDGKPYNGKWYSPQGNLDSEVVNGQ